MFFQTAIPQKKPSERPLAASKTSQVRKADACRTAVRILHDCYAAVKSRPISHGGATERQSGLVKEHICPSRTPRLLTG